MQVAKLDGLAKRGIWKAPWKGERDEMVLVAVNSRQQRIAELEVPLGGNHVEAAELLFAALEDMDPDPHARLRVV